MPLITRWEHKHTFTAVPLRATTAHARSGVYLEPDVRVNVIQVCFIQVCMCNKIRCSSNVFFFM